MDWKQLEVLIMLSILKHGNRHVVRRSFTECVICRWQIPHDGSKLGLHFQQYHPLVGMREYFDNYVADLGTYLEF